MKRKKPRFLRQEWWKRKRLKLCWRKPKGLDSKLRKGLKGYGYRVKIGWRSPKETRGLYKGLEEVRVFNPADLEGLDPKKHIVRIASTVGKKKRQEIVKAAGEKGLKIANQGFKV